MNAVSSNFSKVTGSRPGGRNMKTISKAGGAQCTAHLEKYQIVLCTSLNKQYAFNLFKKHTLEINNFSIILLTL